MLIIDVRESDSIEKALKKYKRKFLSTGTMRQLRKRKNFTKPSVTRRQEVLRAEYRETLRQQGKLDK